MKLSALAVVILAFGIILGLALPASLDGPAAAAPKCPPSSRNPRCATPTPTPTPSTGQGIEKVLAQGVIVEAGQVTDLGSFDTTQCQNPTIYVAAALQEDTGGAEGTFDVSFRANEDWTPDPSDTHVPLATTAVVGEWRLWLVHFMGHWRWDPQDGGGLAGFELRAGDTMPEWPRPSAIVSVFTDQRTQLTVEVHCETGDVH